MTQLNLIVTRGRGSEPVASLIKRESPWDEKRQSTWAVSNAKDLQSIKPQHKGSSLPLSGHQHFLRQSSNRPVNFPTRAVHHLKWTRTSLESAWTSDAAKPRISEEASGISARYVGLFLLCSIPDTQTHRERGSFYFQSIAAAHRGRSCEPSVAASGIKPCA